MYVWRRIRDGLRGWFERKTHRGKDWFVRGLVAVLGSVPRHSFSVPRPVCVWLEGGLSV